ncbi:MAG: hypothetical protein RR359_02760 [Bacilli bacterium]
MYTEENERKGFNVKDFLIKVILIILFVLLLMWLLPLGKDNGKVNPLLDNLFSENIIKMKEAAINYYTLERLPIKVEDKKILTLKEMQNMKLLSPFMDKNGKTCDVYNSYVEIIKKDNEYVLKVNLKCSDKEDYILVHLGCYDYCKTYLCENKDNKPTPPPVNPDKPTPPPVNPDKPTPPPVDPDKPTPPISYIYEYSKWFANEYSAWSEWSKDTPYKLGEIQFGTTEFNIKEDLGIRRVLVGYNVIKDKTKPLYHESYVKVGTVKERVCREYGYYVISSNVYQDTDWVNAGVVKSKVGFNDTATTKYEYIGSDWGDCPACTSAPYKLYQKYVRVQKSVGTTGSVSVTCKDYDTKTIDVYGLQKTLYGLEETRTPVYGDVYFYRQKSRTITKYAFTDIKWSNYNDKGLLNAGYKYTGNKKAK